MEPWQPPADRFSQAGRARTWGHGAVVDDYRGFIRAGAGARKCTGGPELDDKRGRTYRQRGSGARPDAIRAGDLRDRTFADAAPRRRTAAAQLRESPAGEQRILDTVAPDPHNADLSRQPQIQ